MEHTMEHTFSENRPRIGVVNTTVKLDQSVRYLKQAKLELSQIEGQRDILDTVEHLISELNEVRYATS